MAETAGTPACSIKIIDSLKLRLNYFSEDHLSDPHAARHGESFFGVIDQNDLDLAAIIRIDRTGRVEERDPMLDRKTTPWTDLGFQIAWKRDDDPCGDQNAFPRLDRHGFLAGSQKIDAARPFGLILGKRQAFEMR